mmetsp:Transcript_1275/g.2802  ORF Transcript_1275/g.2802 Transcript_1275/m.2802 type:complete len:219 (+) Transcript_1275:155-811(+)
MMGTIGLILGVYASFGCTTFSFPLEGGGEILAGLFAYKTKAFTIVNSNIWVSDVCVVYDNLLFSFTTDSTTKIVEGLAIAAAVIGGIAVLISCLSPCCADGLPNMAWKGLGFLFLVTCGLQGGTLVLYNASICTDNPVVQYLEVLDGDAYEQLVDPTQCQWAPGYKMNISSIVFYFVAGLATFCTSPPGFSDGGDYEDGGEDDGEADRKDDGEDEGSA